MTKRATKRRFADQVVVSAIDYATDGLKVAGAARRAKLYREAGLELLAMAAQIDAELALDLIDNV